MHRLVYQSIILCISHNLCRLFVAQTKTIKKIKFLTNLLEAKGFLVSMLALLVFKMGISTNYLMSYLFQGSQNGEALCTGVYLTNLYVISLSGRPRSIAMCYQYECDQKSTTSRICRYISLQKDALCQFATYLGPSLEPQLFMCHI